MMSSMDLAALVAPVTALDFIQDRYLLAGEGPLLTVYSLRPRPKASVSLSVLQHYRIHGIRPRLQSTVDPKSNRKEDGLSLSTEFTVYDLVVFGGKAVRLVQLHVDQQRLEALGPLVELQDWALDVRWLTGDGPPLLCVALAHNKALLLDTNTGTPLFQHSCVEGCLLYSALLLVHQSWTDTVLVGGTVFNQLILWKPGEEGGSSEHKAPVQRRLLGHSGVIFSISYLQDEGCLASASDDRSVRVWGVGALGGPGGSCGDPDPICLRVLYGHQARVFSVCLAPGQVFSAGEDGACLVWDGGRVVRTLKGHRAGGIRALAVSDGTEDEDKWVATGGADGGVRVWRVEANDDRKESLEEPSEKLTDLEFCGGVPKVVCAADEDESSWHQSGFVVCTDLGSVYQYKSGLWSLVWRGPSDFQSYCVMETVSVGVESSSVQICAVGNLSGSVFVFLVSHPQSGIFLNAGSGKVHSIIWQKDEDGGFLLASGAEGHVHRWCVQVTSGESCHLGLSVLPLPGFLLPLCAKRWLTGAVRVRSGPQATLWICGDRRGSLLLFEEEDKSNTEEEKERMKVTKNRSALEPVSVLFGAHGKQGVTAVTERFGLFYSTGRDGCVRIFRVRQTKQDQEEKENGSSGAGFGLQLEVLRVQRACKGMEWLDRVLVLEPETTEEEEEVEEEEGMSDNLDKGTFKIEEYQVRETRFVMAGFHGVHFVVWDPVKQERLLAVPCGGGHRSWTLWPSQKGTWPGYGALVFIKQGALMVSQPPGQSQTWTGTMGWTLRDGVHGRGVGCVQRLGRVGQPEGLWEVAVTGGEDTSMAVLAVRPDCGAVQVLSVLTDHISSIRTLTAVTRKQGKADGDRTPSLSALLVSAGGRAQIQCYRLLIGWDQQRVSPSCQVIQVARHRLDEQWERKKDRHKMVKMDPETRYMSVVVVEEGSHGVVVALGCSDGAVRLFSISETKHHIDLLWESFYHQRCVLSVATCSLEDAKGNRFLLLFSASTDGHISVWDLPPPSSSQTPPLPCLSFPAHQSGVNALAVWTEADECGCLVTVASGGDDGQLTVSVMGVHFPPEASRGTSPTSEPLNRIQVWLRSQARVPLAHAAPLTALQALRPGLLVSTSSDQRVCLWRVGSAGVVHRGAVCSHVADTAALSVWEGDRDPRREKERETETIGETDGRTEEEEGLDDEDEGGGGATETGDPFNETRDRQCGNQSHMDHGRLRMGTNEEQVDWVLVCGQGVQLLRLRQTNT